MTLLEQTILFKVLRPTIDFNEENDHGTFIFLLDHQRVDCAWFDRITLVELSYLPASH